MPEHPMTSAGCSELAHITFKSALQGNIEWVVACEAFATKSKKPPPTQPQWTTVLQGVLCKVRQMGYLGCSRD